MGGRKGVSDEAGRCKRLKMRLDQGDLKRNRGCLTWAPGRLWEGERRGSVVGQGLLGRAAKGLLDGR